MQARPHSVGHMGGQAAQRREAAFGQVKGLALQPLGIQAINRVAPRQRIQVQALYVAGRVGTEPAHQPGRVVTVTKIVKAAGIALLARKTQGFVVRLDGVGGRPPSRPAVGVVMLLAEQALILIQFQRMVALMVRQCVTHLPVRYARWTALCPLQDAHIGKRRVDDQHIQLFAGGRIAADFQPRQVPRITEVSACVGACATGLVHPLAITVVAVEFFIAGGVIALDVRDALQLVAGIPAQCLPRPQGPLIAVGIKTADPTGHRGHVGSRRPPMIAGARERQLACVATALGGHMA